jgi:NitT/TauT family transport system substrate-binding protein
MKPPHEGSARAVLAMALGFALLLGAACASRGAAPAASDSSRDAPASAAAAESRAPAPLAKVVVGTSARDVGNLPIYMAQEYGLFAAEGLEVETIAATTNVTIAALVARDMDYTTGFASSLAAAISGSPLMAVYSLRDKPLVYLVTRGDVTDGATLRGGVVGHGGTRGSHWFAAVEMVKHLGLDPERDVQLLSVGDVEKGFAALFSGSVAGVVLSPPYDSRAVAAGYRRLVDGSQMLPRYPEAGLIAHKGKLQENPDEVRRMTRAVLKATQYAQANREQGIALVQRDWDLDGETARIAVETVMPTFNLDGEVSDEVMRAAIQRAQAELSDPPPSFGPQDFVDWTYVREARRALGR